MKYNLAKQQNWLKKCIIKIILISFLQMFSNNKTLNKQYKGQKQCYFIMQE